MSERARILRGDYQRTLDRIPETVDLIFLDPPYHNMYYDDCLARIAVLDALRAGGLLAVEHDSRLRFAETAAFQKIKEKTYGGVGVTIFAKRETMGAAGPPWGEK
jgi:16S rRNA (guanine966-N2)-methyltransferase